LTPTRTLTPSRTASATRTGSRTATASRTPSHTATVPQPSPTQSRSPTRTTSPTPVPTGTRTSTVTRTGTPTRTQTGPPPSATSSRTNTPTRTLTGTRTPTGTATATRTRSATRTSTASRTPTQSRTITRTPTITPTFATIGPQVAFFGLARADGRVVTPVATAPDGAPIYSRAMPFGFLIVLEFRPGQGGLDVGTSTFRSSPSDPNLLPDVQMVSSHALGNGSAAICDITAPSFIGGVPAVNPPMFGGTQAAANAINDLACRFDARTTTTDACTRNAAAEERFVSTGSRIVQFCSEVGVGQELAFRLGDTRLTARGLDVAGRPGPPASIVVRVTGN
jgi:hypothetical protein